MHFSEDALKFLRGLGRHNEREWFNARKAVYEAELKAPLLALMRGDQREAAGVCAGGMCGLRRKRHDADLSGYPVQSEQGSVQDERFGLVGRGRGLEKTSGRRVLSELQSGRAL